MYTAPATPTASSPPLRALQQQLRAQARQAAAPLPPRPHEQVLAALLEQIQPIDFRERAGIADQPEEKLRTSDLVIYTAEEVLRLAAANNWGLARNEGSPFVYLYNGAYWKTIPKERL